ncbi:hypothetical protein TeGR_g3400, partial [Tetraparma gracilis]
MSLVGDVMDYFHKVVDGTSLKDASDYEYMIKEQKSKPAQSLHASVEYAPRTKRPTPSIDPDVAFGSPIGIGKAPEAPAGGEVKYIALSTPITRQQKLPQSTSENITTTTTTTTTATTAITTTNTTGTAATASDDGKTSNLDLSSSAYSYSANPQSVLSVYSEVDSAGYEHPSPAVTSKNYRFTFTRFLKTVASAQDSQFKFSPFHSGDEASESAFPSAGEE